MKTLFKTLVAGLALAVTPFLGATNAQAQGFSTTEIQLHYGDNYLLGRNGINETQRSTITLEHFSARKWGDVFFFIDNFKDGDGTGRASDQYGELFVHFSGKNMGLSFGEDSFIKDVGLGLGVNQGTDFTVGLIGARANFNVPGFRVLSFGVYSYDTMTDPFGRDLDTTYQATVVWDRPFEVGNQKFQFKGFVDFIGERGGSVAEQVVFSPQIRWDAGHAMGQKPGKFNLGIEYTHFKNKFGVKAADENSASIFAAFRF